MRKTSTDLNKSTVARSVKRNQDPWKDRDEYSYQGLTLPNDPIKRFAVNGEIDSRIIRDVVPLEEKQIHYPKRVDNVDSI